MKTSAAVLLLFLTVISSRAAYATCSVTSTQTAPAVALDLSADLIGATTTVSKVSQTNFSGPFTCTTALPLFPNTIGIDSPFNGRTATIGFNNGAQLVNITLTALTKNNVSAWRPVLTTGLNSIPVSHCVLIWSPRRPATTPKFRVIL